MPRHWGSIALGLILFWLVGSAVLSWISVRVQLPLLKDLVFQAQQQAMRDAQASVHNNLQLMATRLGELQAELQQIRSIGNRISATPPTQPVRKLPDAQGGPQVNFRLTEDALKREIDRFAHEVSRRTEEMTLLESAMTEARVLRRFLPTTIPVSEASLGSPFGYRADPFTGNRSLHEGLDFAATVGTSVRAAASGTVVAVGPHPEYGYLIVLDHGGNLQTRYAHLSRIDVRTGQKVKQGEQIGAVGNTGRSTGPHLHFEVRSQGVALNPTNFLSANTRLAHRLPSRQH